MKEIRGMDAVRYAEREGISFNVDVPYLARAGDSLLWHPTAPEEGLNTTHTHPHGATGLLPGSDYFNALIERYGDGWVYVPVEGQNPEEEEEVALRLYRRPLGEKVPSSWADVKELVALYRPQLGNTGFPPDADLNLLFHAALRLTGQEKLESITDESLRPGSDSSSYGRRRFIIPPDAEIYLGTLLCGRCRDEYDKAYLILHYECAGRLRKELTKVLSRRRAG